MVYGSVNVKEITSMKKIMTLTDVICEVEKYGQRKYNEGRRAAYNTMVRETADLLATCERCPDLDSVLCNISEFLETVEQIAALVGEE